MSVVFVAEVSSNHHRDLERSCAFIDVAAGLGCGAVKFQLFKIGDLFAPKILRRSEMHRRRSAWELPVEFLPVLAARCRAAGIAFSCTPFYLRAVGELEPFVDFFKVGSYELLWDDLLREVARTGKPLVLSTGMANLDEVRHAVEVARNAGCDDLTLLHCVSGYPTPIADCNLAAIETLRGLGANRAGWSDHTVCPGVLHRAVHRWGVSMIEFHLDLDGQGDEFGAGHCWLPEQIEPVIRAVADGFRADGTGAKKPAAAEEAERAWRADPSDGLRPLLETRTKWR